MSQKLFVNIRAKIGFDGYKESRQLHESSLLWVWHIPLNESAWTVELGNGVLQVYFQEQMPVDADEPDLLIRIFTEEYKIDEPTVYPVLSQYISSDWQICWQSDSDSIGIYAINKGEIWNTYLAEKRADWQLAKNGSPNK